MWDVSCDIWCVCVMNTSVAILPTWEEFQNRFQAEGKIKKKDQSPWGPCAPSQYPTLKNSLPVVPRQFLFLSYPLWNRPLNCPLKWFDPWKYGIWQKIVPQVVPRIPSWWGYLSGKTWAKIVPRQFLPRSNQMSHWALWAGKKKEHKD